VYDFSREQIAPSNRQKNTIDIRRVRWLVHEWRRKSGRTALVRVGPVGQGRA